MGAHGYTAHLTAHLSRNTLYGGYQTFLTVMQETRNMGEINGHDCWKYPGQRVSLNLSSHKSQQPTSMPYRQGLGREI